MPHPARCRLRALLGFPLRDSAAAPKGRAARTSGCTLAGGAKCGGSDGKGKGSNNRPKRHERPIAAAARGMGRGGV